MRGDGDDGGGAGRHDPTDSRGATAPATRPSCSQPDIDPTATDHHDPAAAADNASAADGFLAAGYRPAARHPTDPAGYQRPHRTRSGAADNRPPDPPRPGRHRRPAVGGTPHGTTTADVGPPDQPAPPDHGSDDDGSPPDDDDPAAAE